MSITIRSALPADVPLILRLIAELASYERLADEAVATEEGVHEALFGDWPAAEALIAEWNGEPAGMALFFHNFSTFLGRRGLYLEDLFVREQFRGEGVGRALLTRLAALAVERGCGRFEWSVLDWNEPAIGFYHSLGAVPQEGWTVYRLSGSELMSLAKQYRAGPAEG